MGMSSALPAPTRAEQLRMDLITQGGCITCWAFAEVGCVCEVHHLTIGGKHGAPRRGHAYTLGLCPWHHRGAIDPAQAQRLGVYTPAGMAELVGASYARLPVLFRTTFGRDDALLRIQSRRLEQVAASYLIHPGRYADPALPGGFAP